jgi:hypothetical protein
MLWMLWLEWVACESNDVLLLLLVHSLALVGDVPLMLWLE